MLQWRQVFLCGMIRLVLRREWLYTKFWFISIFNLKSWTYTIDCPIWAIKCNCTLWLYFLYHCWMILFLVFCANHFLYYNRIIFNNLKRPQILATNTCSVYCPEIALTQERSKSFCQYFKKYFDNRNIYPTRARPFRYYQPCDWIHKAMETMNSCMKKCITHRL